MRKDIRDEILDAARSLFIAKGYHGVSLQDIADAVGISKGNLTYHFNKKETIMEALLSRHETRKRPAVPTTLQELDRVFLDMQQAIQHNAYYFLHHAELFQLSPKIAEMQAAVYRENTKLLKQAFVALHEAGILREALFVGEYDSIIDTLHMACIYWQPYSELRQAEGAIVGYRQQAWSILYRLLTEKGQLELNSIDMQDRT